MYFDTLASESASIPIKKSNNLRQRAKRSFYLGVGNKEEWEKPPPVTGPFLGVV